MSIMLRKSVIYMAFEELYVDYDLHNVSKALYAIG